MSKLMIGGLMMCLALLAVFAMPAEAITYSFTPQNSYAAANYPDEGGITLTDGVLGSAGGNGWTDPAEVGWISGATPGFPLLQSVTITIDLGANTEIGGAGGYFYSDGGGNNMRYPIEVEVLTAPDGGTFTSQGSVFPIDTTPAFGNGRTWIDVNFVSAVTARHIQIVSFLSLSGSDGWLFLSEIEILEATALQAFLANLQAQIDAIGPGLQGPKGDKGDKGDPGEITLEELDNAIEGHAHDKGSGSRATGPGFFIP